jgi:short subunit dehydrogenase-like uncharacterized protein
MPSRLATSLTVKLCGGNSFFNTPSFLSGEYRVTHSSLALCSINDDLMRVTTSLTQGEGPPSWLLRDGGFEIEVSAIANGKVVHTRISGQGDPGYGATSKMLAELGLCLALDDHSGSSHPAGVLTPSTGLGHALVFRLTQAQGGKFMQFDTEPPAAN